MRVKPGKPLDKIIFAEGTRKSNRELEFINRWDLVVAIARAVVNLHEAGVIHRDLKPQNIVSDLCGLYLIDWEGAEEERDNIEYKLLATPSYMDPRMYREEEIKKENDIWSLAIILCEVLQQELCFESLKIYNNKNRDSIKIAQTRPNFLEEESGNPKINSELDQFFHFLYDANEKRPNAKEILKKMCNLRLQYWQNKYPKLKRQLTQVQKLADKARKSLDELLESGKESDMKFWFVRFRDILYANLYTIPYVNKEADQKIIVEFFLRCLGEPELLKSEKEFTIISITNKVNSWFSLLKNNQNQINKLKGKNSSEFLAIIESYNKPRENLTHFLEGHQWIKQRLNQFNPQAKNKETMEENGSAMSDADLVSKENVMRMSELNLQKEKKYIENFKKNKFLLLGEIYQWKNYLWEKKHYKYDSASKRKLLIFSILIALIDKIIEQAQNRLQTLSQNFHFIFFDKVIAEFSRLGPYILEGGQVASEVASDGDSIKSRNDLTMLLDGIKQQFNLSLGQKEIKTVFQQILWDNKEDVNIQGIKLFSAKEATVESVLAKHRGKGRFGCGFFDTRSQIILNKYQQVNVNDPAIPCLISKKASPAA